MTFKRSSPALMVAECACVTCQFAIVLHPMSK
jgi:hypothetical protein